MRGTGILIVHHNIKAFFGSTNLGRQIKKNKSKQDISLPCDFCMSLSHVTLQTFPLRVAENFLTPCLWDLLCDLL